jgi:cell fate (sporulation/competence/biofilm development) regulator YlbF (YheA/YmcA/DUF963 family)
LIYTENTFEIENDCDVLKDVLIHSKAFQQLLVAKRQMENDAEVGKLRFEFLMKKERFEEYEKYAEDKKKLQSLKLEMIRAKRKLDMNEVVSNYRLLHTEIQSLLDTIVTSIAGSIDEEIKVDAGSALFKNNGCKGGCAHGCGHE